MKKLLFTILSIGLIIGCKKDDDKLNACFTFSHNFTSSTSAAPNRDSIVFANCSDNATNFVWDFGDGTSSTEINPIKVYNVKLPMVVTLTAYNGTKTHVKTDTISDFILAYKPNVYIYPENKSDLYMAFIQTK